MTDFQFQDMLPLGKDETPYRLVSSDFVSTFDAGQECGFILSVFSDVPLDMVDGSTLREIPTTVPAT